MARRIEELECFDCGDEAIYMDVKEEPSVYKVGAQCFGCDQDYGVLQRVSRSDVGHVDELYEEAEDAVREFFEGDQRGW